MTSSTMLGPDLLLEATDLLPEMARVRRELHARPELGLALPQARAAVLAELRDLPVRVVTGRALSSVVAVVEAPASVGDRPALLLRADMDAVPVQEDTGLGFASTERGVAHACGHDLHTAMLLGAARLICRRRDELAADVVLMFQPGEEGWEGARAMIEEGVLDVTGQRVAAAYGLHVFSTLDPGFHLRPGPMMAASSSLTVTVRGRGGHASAPHLAEDPVPVAAEMVVALQTLVTRTVDVFDPAVLTVGVFEAGTRRNVIPNTARFEATIRTFSHTTADRLAAAVTRLVDGIAAAHGLDADVELVGGRPATVNDPACTRHVEGVIDDVLGPAHRHRLEHPFTGSEDFSRVLVEVPGAFVALGARPPHLSADEASFNHSGKAVFDEDVMPAGAALLAGLALSPSHPPNQETR